MSRIIIDLLPEEFWYNLFVLFFFIGLILMSLIIVGGFMHSDGDVHADSDMDHDVSLDHDMDMDHDVSLDHDMDMDHDLSLDHDMDMDHDLSLDHDMDMDHDLSLDHDMDSNMSEQHLGIHHGELLPESELPKSRHILGNISSFMLAFGEVGWINISKLSDEILLISIVAGYIASKIFAWILASYAKTTFNPIQMISQGDLATVTSSVTFDKVGLVNVQRKDGVISTVLAKGAFPHDNFENGDQGHIWGKDGTTYTLTHVFWEKKKARMQKALDYKNQQKALDTYSGAYK